MLVVRAMVIKAFIYIAGSRNILPQTPHPYHLDKDIVSRLKTNSGIIKHQQLLFFHIQVVIAEIHKIFYVVYENGSKNYVDRVMQVLGLTGLLKTGKCNYVLFLFILVIRYLQ